MADEPTGDAETTQEPGPESGQTAPLPRPFGTFTRRTFLAGAAGAAGFAGIASVRRRVLPGARPLAAGPAATGPAEAIGHGNGGPDFTISAERDLDLTLLDFSFYGFSIESGTIVPYTEDNVIVVQFPPQAIAEGDYTWQGNVLDVDPPPILSDVAGPSRLCFTIGTSQTIPLPHMSVQDLLDWSDWDLLVPPVAEVNFGVVTGEPPIPTEPTAMQTAIEFPYALFLAPTVAVGDTDIFGRGFSTEFLSRSAPLISPATAVAPGVVDLWSTYLAGTSESRPVIINGEDAAPVAAPYTPQVSAVWALDYVATEYAPPPDATGEKYIQYDYQAAPQ